ncbi:uncharacterized protein AMSG_10212 [Thecamonas trahens ATCC 50062]|uniref:Uncharacterized protein n=1 Tax=Thecamonas trahens ATCC 50062 TaxID=461836 RepID=A0A0L0DRU9_THETB|nr:hypothetical protein AMSG_10212 [Thecamonas trahens ATCC 50062]KNC54967.1 hypothetical protein AMSG_10212 [Thecamonas trahens ATCC 50062]|eukprot:XP_013753414.1 hypothetical protein AMSG_10212 [Thecamonas trahens ATCC 50062]
MARRGRPSVLDRWAHNIHDEEAAGGSGGGPSGRRAGVGQCGTGGSGGRRGGGRASGRPTGGRGGAVGSGGRAAGGGIGTGKALELGSGSGSASICAGRMMFRGASSGWVSRAVSLDGSGVLRLGDQVALELGGGRFELDPGAADGARRVLEIRAGGRVKCALSHSLASVLDEWAEALARFTSVAGSSRPVAASKPPASKPPALKPQPAAVAARKAAMAARLESLQQQSKATGSGARLGGMGVVRAKPKPVLRMAGSGAAEASIERSALVSGESKNVLKWKHNLA